MVRILTFAGSSALRRGAYDDETQELTLTFASGRSYTYPGVPPEVVTALEAAPSAGEYFNAAIKGVYG